MIHNTWSDSNNGCIIYPHLLVISGKTDLITVGCKRPTWSPNGIAIGQHYYPLVNSEEKKLVTDPCPTSSSKIKQNKTKNKNVNRHRLQPMSQGVNFI